MYITEPFNSFESPMASPVSVPTGLRALAAVFAIAFTLFVVLLVATPSITRICPAPRAGAPVHLAR